MKEYILNNVEGSEILDSRGNPTIKVIAKVNESIGEAKVPSGASTGKYEAVELRDRDKKRFNGKGVLKAVKNVNEIIKDAFKTVNESQKVTFKSLEDFDKLLILLDGSENKANLGANAMLGTSIAIARAMAKERELELFQFLGGENAYKLPVPMMNVLNGGEHAGNNLDIQEFMIMPIGAKTFKEAVKMSSEVYHKLGKILKDRELNTGIGDEGGYAPDLKNNEEALSILADAVKESGYKLEEDFVFAIDAAASTWKSKTGYLMPKSNTEYTTDELIQFWEDLISKYPIYSLEDPLDEEDFEGFAKLTEKIGNKVQIVGDDLYVTNISRLTKGIDENASNSILIKPNQIGTLTETLSCINMAKDNGFTTIISHRSGETADTLIADLAVAINAGQIKTGAPARSERVEKYNRLMEIEERLGDKAYYPGISCFTFYKKG